MSKKHTYDLGIIGNCAYLSLIDKKANVKWLCWPKFDSSFVFGSLLDEEKGGEFSIKPIGETFKTEQYYIDNTNVLCTDFTDGDSKFRVTDFAPRFHQNDRYFKPLMFIRKIEPLAGSPVIRVACEPRGEYGKVIPEKYMGSNHIRFLGLEKSMRLTTNIPLN